MNTVVGNATSLNHNIAIQVDWKLFGFFVLLRLTAFYIGCDLKIQWTRLNLKKKKKRLIRLCIGINPTKSIAC